MPERRPVLIALGSNIDREENIERAIALLRRTPSLEVLALSPVYESAPVGGPPNQLPYFNAAALIATELSPPALRETLRAIEHSLGRVRTEDKYAPRTIDLDIALYAQEAFDLNGRHVPDPDIMVYPHLALPLADVAPTWIHPETGQSLGEIAGQLKSSAATEVYKVMSDQRMNILHTNGHYAVNLDAGPHELYDPEFEALVRQMLVQLGEDPEREGLKRTPLRVAKAMDFLTSGYTTSLDEIVNDAVFEDECQEMVIVRDIEFYSLCEHHILPFFGRVHVGYLPQGKIIGLSKVARVVDMYARRLQVQERLTSQVADALMEILNPLGVGVVIEASHFCMMMRGVQKQNSSTTTSATRGTFREDARTREEFMQLLRG